LSPFLQEVLEVAGREVGIREVGRNRGQRIEEYQACVGIEPGSPWCAAFVSWVFREASRTLGIPCPLHPSGGALKLWRWAAPATRTQWPKPGGVFVIDHGAGLGHVGIVESVTPDHLVTIEGNTNDGGAREGDGVYRRIRRKSEINVGYIDTAPDDPVIVG
jgi:hypothetical protein